MKTAKYLYLALFIILFGVDSLAQKRNVLQVKDVTTQIGSLQLPVYIENTDEIVGAQFDLTLPEGVIADPVGTLANRSDGHSVTVNRLSSGTYRVLLHSAQNRPLRGQSGVVMYLPITIPASFEEGSEHALSIANAVLGKATGENVLTEASAGNIRISRLPDLAVKNINCDNKTLNPGDRIVVSWQVENIGELSTGGGWSEQVSLISEDGTQSKLLATNHYDDILDASGIVSRQAEINLPELLGIDGSSRMQVRIVPDNNTGESSSAQGNNVQMGNDVISINKMLTMELSPNRVDENGGKRLTLKVSRSGNWTAAEVFNIVSTADGRISMPNSITIPANQSGAIVYINVMDNDVLDNDSIINVSIEGNGYDAVTTKLYVVDNEYPDLKIETSKTVLKEGETFQLMIKTNRVSDNPILVTLTSENAKRFKFPAQVTIPAGEISQTVDVVVIDDNLPSLSLSNVFSVYADKHNKAEVTVLLEDDDMPALELTISPTQVSESAGPVSVAGILRRTTNTDSRIIVRMTDDSNGRLYFGNREFVLEKGVEEVHFNFGPVDNAIVDGDLTCTITAAVWLSSCSCGASGESAGYVEAKLQVFDNDGPALNLASSLSTVKEGGKTNLTISRNTADNAAPLTVTLNSDYEEGLSYEHTVIIPAGQQSTTVEVTSAGNSIQGDSHTVIFIVQAEGYAKGTCFVMVTDQTLPDARISSITADATEAEVGTQVKLNIQVTNDGAAELPLEVPIKIYHRGESSAIATFYTPQALAIGESVQVSRTITLPTTVGNHNYYAVVNETNKVNELSYTNNTSVDAVVKVITPFSVTLTTDKKVYQQGEKILITGQLKGNETANTEVDLYVLNEGARQVQKVTTDAQGAFTYEWELYSLQSGHFVVGACYPNEGLNTEMASFDVYGLRRSNSGYIKCEIANGETTTGQVGIYNPGVLNLTGVKATIISSPDNCEAMVNIPTTITGGQTVQLDYSLKGTAPSLERKWYEVKVQITTNEGVTSDATIYFYCFNNTATLVANTNRINTTITKGTVRDYPLQIVNTGKGASGIITLALPEWITCASGITIPSMNQNDTVNVILRMASNNKMQLNVPVTGSIGVNCANGNGLTINYSVEPVSEETGTLVVDVCDEYTYNTTEAPHVKGAEVVIRHPYTGVEITRGVTGDEGTYSIELPEGYYKVIVSADKHEQYTNYCNVNPGKTENLVVNISYQPITIQWGVEETEVEDEYEITTTVVYETNVPKPVVKVTLPKSIDGDNMAIGDNVIINMLLTNIGLINAEEVELDLPTNMSEWKFEALAYTEPFTLAPQQMVNVPVKITRTSDGMSARANQRTVAKNMISDYQNCMAGLGSWYKDRCGKDLKTNHAAERMAMKVCAVSATMQAIGEALGGLFGGGGLGGPGGPSGGGGGGSGNGDGDTNYNGVTRTFDICDPCQAEIAERLINTLIGHTWLGMFNNAVQQAIEEYQSGGKGNYRFVVKTVGGDVVEKGRDAIIDHYIENGSTMAGYVIEVYKLIQPCEQTEPDEDNSSQSRSSVLRRASKYSWQNEFNEIAETYIEQIKAMDEIMLYIYGDRIWYDELDDEKADFIEYVTNLEDGYVPSNEELMAHKPSSVTMNQMMAYVNHVLGNNQTSTDELEKHIATYDKIHEKAVLNGYESMTDYFKDAFDTYQNNFAEMTSSSVCASITLQFKQTMTMTRQAFRGSLVVFNGHERLPMQNVKLNLEVINNSTGEVATSHEFQINPEKIDGFAGELDLNNGWTLDANTTGTATILFIPTKYAAPENPVEWSFGGTLSYIDPFTGLEVTRELYPVTLTVKPSPELDLDYFMQRDIYGDDPLTADVVEPMEPAEFALIINNKGHGDAANVRMVTQQPEIIENEKGLLVNFMLISSQINGGDANLSFGKSIANNFGTISAHSQAYAQWWLQSSLLGHFTEYNVQANHVTSYGNEDLSLLDKVDIHELIHGFTVKSDEGNVRGFLVNEITDSEDTPDSIFFTDATQQGVKIASNAHIDRQSDTEYMLNVNVANAGWNYGNLLDPTYGKQKLVKITRADGTEVNIDNVWQTDRTLRDGKDWLYENRLHFIGNMSADGETFYLTFEPKPEVELAVENYAGVPEEGTALMEQLTQLTVKFNKPIKSETFTTEDITLNCQGIAQDASQIVIESLNEQEYKLTLNEVTLHDGYYVLTVQTAGIEDNEGFYGSTGKQATWIQFVDGKVALKVTASPVEGGTVTPASGRFDYDSEVTLKAAVADGYDFTGWILDGEVVSTNSEYTYHLTSDTELNAMFTIKHFNVNIDYDSTQGTIEGAATGIYDYGTQLVVNAVPNDGYVFDIWRINDIESKDNTQVLIVNSDISLNALFKENDIVTNIPSVNSDNLIVHIAPIPLENYMNISGNFKTIQYVGIYDMRGMKISGISNVQNGKSIHIGNVSAGIYFIIIKTDKGVYRAKVVKR